MSLPESEPLALEKREFAKFCSSPDSSFCLPCDCCAFTFEPCIGKDKTYVSLAALQPSVLQSPKLKGQSASLPASPKDCSSSHLQVGGGSLARQTR